MKRKTRRRRHQRVADRYVNGQKVLGKAVDATGDINVRQRRSSAGQGRRRSDAGVSFSGGRWGSGVQQQYPDDRPGRTPAAVLLEILFRCLMRQAHRIRMWDELCRTLNWFLADVSERGRKPGE